MKKWINIIALILVTVGSILLSFSSDRTNATIREMLVPIQSGYGRVSQEPFTEQEIERFQDGLAEADDLSEWGYGLFMIGFFLQLLESLYNFRKQKLLFLIL